MTRSAPPLYLSLAAALTTASCRSSTSPTAPETTAAEAARRQIVVLGDSLAVSPSLSQSFPAARYGVPSVPFLLEGVALNPDLNGDDGIHPNAAGARLIAETVWPYLEPLLAQRPAR